MPWLPVASAPATVCAVMVPTFASASPTRSRAALSTASEVPPPTVTVLASRSIDVTPAHADMSSSVPSVQTSRLNECPAPTARTVSPAAAARLSSAATSASVRGRTMRAGRQRVAPDQLRHCTVMSAPSP